MEKLVARLKTDYPRLLFSPGATNCWSPGRNEISYASNGRVAEAGILHELAHAILSHQAFENDLDLLRKEIDAWEQAKKIAPLYDVIITENYIQNCLDTYRDWVHKRSLCPKCSASGLQTSSKAYYCINCSHTWLVTAERLCRPYRSSQYKKTGA